MKMDAVEARPLRPPRRGGKIGNDLFHLGIRHLHGRAQENGVGNDRRCQGNDVGDQRLAAGVAKLGEDEAAVPMHRLGDAGERSDATVVLETKLSRLILAARFHVDVAGDDESRTTARKITIEADVCFGRLAAVRRHGLGGRRAYQPVLDGEPTDPARRQEGRGLA